ncbi:TIGR02444 family protein [Oceanibacterium hippocampi]|uniref:TIGR02444 family protein n=1 Tax=Oceanibacterium hippocampi TaxID=745714 RepID=A0A1Y5S9P6_9PROT|nr:TIGR02444 family protein [Oceanibacterium hippocampi]SLN35697.1 hypothetical protein OCH7691_01430 [Oceanibacterium hippocampi]
MSPTSFPPNEFWDFSSRLYARDGVAEASLALQDRHGIDVNLLLFCCWVAASGRGTFEDGELESAIDRVAAWRDNVILPLRDLRRYLKGGAAPAPYQLADELRRVIADIELHGEHVEQLILSAGMTRLGTGSFEAHRQARDAAVNLSRYFAILAIGLDEETDRAALRILVSAAFPSVEDWLVADWI